MTRPDSLCTAPDQDTWRPLEPWTLAERYGDYRIGFWLLFRNGSRRFEIEVSKEQWDAFGA